MNKPITVRYPKDWFIDSDNIPKGKLLCFAYDKSKVYIKRYSDGKESLVFDPKAIKVFHGPIRK